jgi:hypothetical protein
MTIELLIKPNDDPQFVELARRVISGLVNDNFPSEIFVVQIDNWFDLKWLNFSGIGRVKFDGHPHIDGDTALDEFWLDKVTFPPFTPRRVLKEYFFERDENGDYSLSTIAPPYIHSRRRARSNRKFHRRLENFTHSAVFMWFSSNTKSNRRGSFMVYEVGDSGINTWYSSFSKEKEEWKVLKTKGINPAQVSSLINQNMLPERI